MAGTNGGEGRQAGREGQRTFMSTGRRLADAQASDAIGMDARDNEGLAGAINEESANEARRGETKRMQGAATMWLGGETRMGRGNKHEEGKNKLKKVYCTTA
jgi:hypothetical protein